MSTTLQNKATNQINVVQSGLEWAKKFAKDNFPVKDFKEYRRQAKKIRKALDSRCSAAAYGESQVGKSYLMSSLLSSAEAPFVVENEGKIYSFVDDLNPSGGNLTKIESTGVITRFTSEPASNEAIRKYVKITNLSITDIILVIADSYYNDVVIDPDTRLSASKINEKLQGMQSVYADKTVRQNYIEEDDVRDIQEYFHRVIGNNASAVDESNFFNVVAENIQHIPVDKWPDVFSLLWNENQNMKKLLANIITEYAKIGFRTTVYVPFAAILRRNGTLLQIQWLDLICGKENKEIDLPVLTTDVYDETGNLIASDFSKAFLSALTAEITLHINDKIVAQRPFLKHIDLLDFPGARSRLQKIEGDLEFVSDMPELLRRGKVAYLFTNYVRNRKINSLLFCHHNDQKSESSIGNSIKAWVEEVVGSNPQERMKRLSNTDFVSPLFFVATKFNIDLAKNSNDRPDGLTNHWRRFTDVIPEIIGSYQWFDSWIERQGVNVPFQNIYPLRDFFWSGNSGAGKSNLFTGYNEGKNGTTPSEETGYVEYADFPDYFRSLKDSFVKHPFVASHFQSPDKAWDSFATPCNDGSLPIIDALSRIAPRLDAAREAEYGKELKTYIDKAINSLMAYYEPDNDEAKSEKTKRIVARVKARLFMSVGANPEVFGRILDSLMVHPEKFRKIARDILVLKTETPRDFSVINFIRANAGIDLSASRETNLKRLLDFFGAISEDDVTEELAAQGLTIEDIVSGEENFCATVSDVITKHILGYWMENLDNSLPFLNTQLPFAEEVVMAFKTLVKTLGIRKKISEKIALYQNMFEQEELLNAISDYAALVLNNFISTVGRKYMTDAHINEIREKALRCGIEVDLSQEGIEPIRKRQELTSVLEALDRSTEIITSSHAGTDLQLLRKLPLWDNFHRWQNLLTIGMILSSGVSTKDPKANLAIKEIIDNANQIYA